MNWMKSTLLKKQQQNKTTCSIECMWWRSRKRYAPKIITQFKCDNIDEKNAIRFDITQNDGVVIILFYYTIISYWWLVCCLIADSIASIFIYVLFELNGPRFDSAGNALLMWQKSFFIHFTVYRIYLNELIHI